MKVANPVLPMFNFHDPLAVVTSTPLPLVYLRTWPVTRIALLYNQLCFLDGASLPTSSTSGQDQYQSCQV